MRLVFQAKDENDKLKSERRATLELFAHKNLKPVQKVLLYNAQSPLRREQIQLAPPDVLSERAPAEQPARVPSLVPAAHLVKEATDARRKRAQERDEMAAARRADGGQHHDQEHLPTQRPAAPPHDYRKE